eukprot:CAMPEP_0194400002 /NCGR_PEP_ID=MMETSP0174-20130528/126971_1 /TAXON_ID=216777 /ORGANISM="Proboscia alata, Strain PI-D3" /LENGTH=53 /DNA_ID=CAMNT_0039196469 /DNA_START=1481 /DNA_END=1642 /DNA_ORIENTATION=-
MMHGTNSVIYSIAVIATVIHRVAVTKRVSDLQGTLRWINGIGLAHDHHEFVKG